MRTLNAKLDYQYQYNMQQGILKSVTIPRAAEFTAIASALISNQKPPTAFSYPTASSGRGHVNSIK